MWAGGAIDVIGEPPPAGKQAGSSCLRSEPMEGVLESVMAGVGANENRVSRRDSQSNSDKNTFL